MEPEEFWSLGDYSIVGDLWAQAGRNVILALDLRDRDVVDLATGTGVAALTAAQHGARSVTGVDVTASLLEQAASRAERIGVQVDWITADMHRVPLPSGCADTVVSTFGLIFSAEPADALREALRLTRPGGQVVFSSWSLSGLFGKIRQTLSRHFPEAPAPWHEDPAQIRALAGPLSAVEERWFTVAVDSPERFVELLEQHSAPFILGAQSLGSRWSEARRDLLETVHRFARKPDDGTHSPGTAQDSPDAGTTLSASYLVTTVPAACLG